MSINWPLIVVQLTQQTRAKRNQRILRIRSHQMRWLPLRLSTPRFATEIFHTKKKKKFFFVVRFFFFLSFLVFAAKFLASCHWTSALERFFCPALIFVWFVANTKCWSDPTTLRVIGEFGARRNLMGNRWTEASLLVHYWTPNNPQMWEYFKIILCFCYVVELVGCAFIFFLAFTSSCARTESSTNVKKRCTVAPFQALAVASSVRARVQSGMDGWNMWRETVQRCRRWWKRWVWPVSGWERWVGNCTVKLG